MPLDLPPTRAAGLARLEAFVPKAGRDYAEGRGFDRGHEGHPAVSVLSPYIRHRMVTEEEVLRAILAAHGGPDGPGAASKSVEEVLWRTYWKGVLELRPGIWSDYRAGLKAALDRVATEAGLRRGWEDACEGRTGIEAFDHWARQIAEDGYVHNHARMWFASIWVFTLRLPWELGADFYLRHLLDGDPASNTCSWRWVAGLQTPGKTYLARAENIARYTGGRFGRERLAAEAEPVDGAPSPPVRALRLPSDPARPEGRWGLLAHEDDLSPALPFGGEADARAVLLATGGRSPLTVAPMVAAFARGAAEDAAARMGGGPVVEGAEAAADWAVEAGLGTVVAPYAMRGPVRAALDAAEAALGARGVALRRAVRPYDAAAWPFATAGFFRFRIAVPELIAPLLPAEAA